MDSAKTYFNFLDNPKYKEKLEAEWNYLRMVHKQGLVSNDRTLEEVALNRMLKFFAEIDRAGYTFTELNLPECFFFRSLLGF